MSTDNNKRSSLTRREFLKNAGLVAGGLSLGSIGLLGACNTQTNTVTNTATSTATITNTATVTNTATNVVTNTVTTSVIPTTTAPPPTSATPSSFPLSVRTRYLHGGIAEQVYDLAPSKAKSVMVTADISQFLVHFGKQDLIYSVWGSYNPNISMTPEEHAVLRSLNYHDDGIPSTERILNSISNGVNLIVTSNPSFIRETIFTRDMEGLNTLGCKYFMSFNAYFHGGDKYSKVNIDRDPETTLFFNPSQGMDSFGCLNYSWDHFFAAARALGVLFSISDAVEEYIDSQMAAINYIKNRAATAANKPKVMFIWRSGNAMASSYNNGLMQLMCENAGCTYLQGQWTNETILELDPDIIIDRCYTLETVPLKDNPMFADLKSVKNKTCYADYNLPWTSNSSSLAVASHAATVASYIHPEWRTG